MRPRWLLLRKDLLVLRRSPLLLGVLIAYPLVIALLIGLTAGYANAKPRVAFVDEDGIPHRLTVARRARFDIDDADRRRREERRARPHVGGRRPAQQLASGRVVAVITVPQGFVADLERARRRART